MRTCIHPLNDADNRPRYDEADTRIRCGQPVPPRRLDAMLCDAHYAPVSDERVKAYVERVLEGG